MIEFKYLFSFALSVWSLDKLGMTDIASCVGEHTCWMLSALHPHLGEVVLFSFISL